MYLSGCTGLEYLNKKDENADAFLHEQNLKQIPRSNSFFLHVLRPTKVNGNTFRGIKGFQPFIPRCIAIDLSPCLFIITRDEGKKQALKIFPPSETNFSMATAGLVLSLFFVELFLGNQKNKQTLKSKTYLPSGLKTKQPENCLSPQLVHT